MLEAQLSTGQLAALVDRSPATIRKYEALGLIPAGHRDPINGRRYWPTEEAETIRRRLQLMPVSPTSPTEAER